MALIFNTKSIAATGVASVAVLLTGCAGVEPAARATTATPPKSGVAVERMFAYANFGQLRANGATRMVVSGTAGEQSSYTEPSAPPAGGPLRITHTSLESVRVLWGTPPKSTPVVVSQTFNEKLVPGKRYILFLTPAFPDTTPGAYAIMEGVGYRLDPDNVYRLISEVPGSLPSTMSASEAEERVRS